MTEEKSLSQWRFELKRFGKARWPKFYEAMTGFPVSNYAKFNQALNRYGEDIFLDALVATSARTFDSDPLNYVFKVAHNKWREVEEERDKSNEYESEIDKAKIQSNRQSDALKKRLEKARKVK